MIYIAGDTHGSLDNKKLGLGFLDSLTKDDYVIVCGDFGGVWRGDRRERRLLAWYEERPFTTLFVDGNHEGFERLRSFPVERWHGGLVHRINGSVIHLMRGQVFDIEGRRFFAMGGAHSSEGDRLLRVAGVSWFKEEVPDAFERARALETLGGCGWRVDYVLTHCAPSEAVRALLYRTAEHPADEYTDWLQREVANRLSFDWWFFGHYHADKEVLGRFHCLYDLLYEVGSGETAPPLSAAGFVMECGDAALLPESLADWGLYCDHEGDPRFVLHAGKRYDRAREGLVDAGKDCVAVEYPDCFVNGRLAS